MPLLHKFIWLKPRNVCGDTCHDIISSDVSYPNCTADDYGNTCQCCKKTETTYELGYRLCLRTHFFFEQGAYRNEVIAKFLTVVE